MAGVIDCEVLPACKVEQVWRIEGGFVTCRKILKQIAPWRELGVHTRID